MRGWRSAARRLRAVWRWPAGTTWAWVVLIAFCGTFSHYCMTRALRYADATVVVPMDFLRVPLSAVVGWLVYTEAIDLFTALGATLILAVVFGFLALSPWLEDDRGRTPASSSSSSRTARSSTGS